MSTFGQHSWAQLRNIDIRTFFCEVENNSLGPVGCQYIGQVEMGGL